MNVQRLSYQTIGEVRVHDNWNISHFYYTEYSGEQFIFIAYSQLFLLVRPLNSHYTLHSPPPYPTSRSIYANKYVLNLIERALVPFDYLSIIDQLGWRRVEDWIDLCLLFLKRLQKDLSHHSIQFQYGFQGAYNISSSCLFTLFITIPFTLI